MNPAISPYYIPFLAPDTNTALHSKALEPMWADFGVAKEADGLFCLAELTKSCCRAYCSLNATSPSNEYRSLT